MAWLDALTSDTGVKVAGVVWAIAATVLASRALTERAGARLASLARRRRDSQWIGSQGHARVTVSRSTTWGTETLPPEPETMETLRAAIESLRADVNAQMARLGEKLAQSEAHLSGQVSEAHRGVAAIRDRLSQEQKDAARWDGRAIPLLGYSVIVTAIPDWIALLPTAAVLAIVATPVAYLWWWATRHRSEVVKGP